MFKWWVSSFENTSKDLCWIHLACPGSLFIHGFWHFFTSLSGVKTNKHFTLWTCWKLTALFNISFFCKLTLAVNTGITWRSFNPQAIPLSPSPLPPPLSLPAKKIHPEKMFYIFPKKILIFRDNCQSSCKIKKFLYSRMTAN